MDYVALIAGLAGALIGAASSLLGQIVQNSYQSRRETTRLLYETAYKDYELRLLHLQDNAAAFPVILDYHQRMMTLASTGRLTPDTARSLFAAQAAMAAAVMSFNEDLDNGSNSPDETA